MIIKKVNSKFFTYEELIKEYISEKYQLVHYEMILDNLYMAHIKDEEWEQKKKDADRLYKESKELIDFLWCLLEIERQKNTESNSVSNLLLR